MTPRVQKTLIYFDDGQTFAQHSASYAAEMDAYAKARSCQWRNPMDWAQHSRNPAAALANVKNSKPTASEIWLSARQWMVYQMLDFIDRGGMGR